MPILTVEIVTHPNESIRPDLAMELANQAVEIFDSAPGNTWIKVYPIVILAASTACASFQAA
jgi:hypothetical protein